MGRDGLRVRKRERERLNSIYAERESKRERERAGEFGQPQQSE